MANIRKRRRRLRRMSVVLGGGGVKIFGHGGTMKAIEELGIEVDILTGVSAGSVWAAFYMNGYTPQEITEILLDEVQVLAAKFPHLSFGTLLKMLAGGLVDLSKMAAELVVKYKLKPHKQLRIVAFNLLTRKPVIFEGTDYDLATAVAASCSVPFVMQPVWNGAGGVVGKVATAVAGLFRLTKQGVLIDGSLHHPNPVVDDRPAIISKLGFATESSELKLSALDRLFHAIERGAAALLEWIYPDPSAEKHVIIQAGMPDVACLTFNLPRVKYLEMVDWAYANAMKALTEAIASGRLDEPSAA